MISIGLVGHGKFGSRVRRVLENESMVDLHWTASSTSKFENLSKVDWVYICSPNECHYENAITFMERGSSVIIEKPPTLSAIALEHLIQKSADFGVEIYFSMIYLFDNQISLIDKPSSFIWEKSIKEPYHDSAFTALLFHHIYIFLKSMNFSVIDELKITKIRFGSPDDFSFKISSSGKLGEFKYFRSPSSSNHNYINDVLIDAGKPDTLAKMLHHVIETPDFKENKKLALHTLRMLENVRSEVFPKIAVVGAGIFGCTAAIGLGNKGFNVDLIERHSQIMQEASSINQYRVHRGYHYPRSDETVSQCAESFPAFESNFHHALVDQRHHSKSYYAIASENSEVSPTEYIDFLRRNELAFEETEIGLTGVALTVEVDERLYNPQKIKQIVADRLLALGVNLVTNKEADRETLTNYSGGVIATYANQGYWDTSEVTYQFELCEKPIVRLPERYSGLSIVIMDGPFMCVDPFSDTGLHVMGNVVHAIHHTSFGTRPIIPKEYGGLLNKGCIIPPKELTNFPLFVQSAQKFFPEIEKAEHIGSMYTVRAVESNREHDDARLTILHKLEGNFHKIFSGKVCTSVDAATKAVNAISKSV